MRFFACKLVLVGDEDVGRGVELPEGLGVLMDGGVLNHDHRLLGRPQAAHLHGHGGEDEGLPGPHGVGHDVRFLEVPGNALFLMVAEFDLVGGVGVMIDVRNREFLQDRVVKIPIIYVRQLLPPFFMLLDPLDEFVLDPLLHVPGGGGFLRVENLLGFVVLVFGIVNRSEPEVQGILDEIEGVGPFDPPDIRDLGRCQSPICLWSG